MRAGPRTEQVRSAVEPNHALGLVTGRRDGGLRRVDRRPGVKHTASRAASIMRALLAGWVGRVRLPLRRSRIAMTNDSRMQRIGGRDAGRPACADRCENLHRQGNQDDRKKFPQPPPHQRTHPSTLLINHAESPESRPGSRRHGCWARQLVFKARFFSGNDELTLYRCRVTRHFQCCAVSPLAARIPS